MKNVLVTGASGFLGKNLVAALTQKECRVYALARHFDAELQNNRNVVCVDVNGKNGKKFVKFCPMKRLTVCFIWPGPQPLALPGRITMCSWTM